MFPKITIEQFRGDLITTQVEIGGLIARRRGPDSMDKPLRFDNIADAFRGAWEAVFELRNEAVPTLVLGPGLKGECIDRAELANIRQVLPLANDPGAHEEAPKTIDTAPPQPKRRGRPPRNPPAPSRRARVHEDASDKPE